MVALAYPYLHLVITDVLMPELDGRALGQRLRERYPALPVLYISAYPSGRSVPSGRSDLTRAIPAEADRSGGAPSGSPAAFGDAAAGAFRHLTAA